MIAAARAWRRAPAAPTPPAPSSTTKAVVRGNRCSCHEVAVPVSPSPRQRFSGRPLSSE